MIEHKRKSRYADVGVPRESGVYIVRTHTQLYKKNYNKYICRAAAPAAAPVPVNTSLPTAINRTVPVL